MNTRRQFLAGSAALAAGAAAPLTGSAAVRPLKRITIVKGTSDLELWPTKGAFGFKGVVQKRFFVFWTMPTESVRSNRSRLSRSRSTK